MAFDAATYEIDPLTLTTPKARLEYLRDFLRGLPKERFRMRAFVTGLGLGTTVGEISHDCKTAGCIAGWAIAKFAPATDRWSGEIGDAASALLGLGLDARVALFYPDGYRDHDDEITPGQASDVLDHLIRTGEVDWSIARKAEVL